MSALLPAMFLFGAVGAVCGGLVLIWWFNQKPAPVPRQAEPTGRCIYQYFDGQQQRFIDPLDVVRRLPKIAYFDPAKDPILCDQDDFDAMERTARASSELFGVKPLGEGGLTEAERIQLLFNFLLWWDGLKKNTATSPSTSPPQAPPPVA